MRAVESADPLGHCCSNHISRAKEFGIASASAQWDFAEVMERVQKIVNDIEPHDSVERYTGLGGGLRARHRQDPHAMGGKSPGRRQQAKLDQKNIVIAAGARPSCPPIPGLAEANPLTSDNIWNLRKLPKRLVIAGRRADRFGIDAVFALRVRSRKWNRRASRSARTSRFQNRRGQFRAEGVDVLTSHKACA